MDGRIIDAADDQLILEIIRQFFHGCVESAKILRLYLDQTGYQVALRFARYCESNRAVLVEGDGDPRVEPPAVVMPNFSAKTLARRRGIEIFCVA